jgi:pimeloyl-ACP methyl ester carboxylesterase
VKRPFLPDRRPRLAPPGTAGGCPLRSLAALAGVALLGLGFVSLSCSSLSKADLEAELLALGKNAPLRARGLERTTLRLAGEELELVFLRVPAVAEAADRIPVVLVHGTPSTLFTWSELASGGDGFAGLAAERTVYLVEVVGHGVAPAGPEPTTFQLCADYVAAALEALDLERAFLVGQSYGGEFAWRAALDHPERVAGLVISNSSGYPRREGDWLPEEVEMRENGLADLGYLLNSRERVATALAPHFRDLPPDRVDEFFLVCENRANWKAMIDLARDENGDRAKELPHIAVPTLVLWGSDDVAYSTEFYAERFARDIPGAELALLADTGHYPHEERPAEVAARLADFFRRVEGTESGR